MPAWLASLLLFLVALLLLRIDVPQPELTQVGLRYGNRVFVPSNQVVSPAGWRIEFPGRPVDMALSPRGDQIAVLLPGSLRFFSFDGRALRTVSLGSASVTGLAFSPDGLWVAVSQVAYKNTPAIVLVPLTAGEPVSISLPALSVPAGLAFDPSGNYLYVALNRRNQVARIDLSRGEVTATVDVGVAPFDVALSRAGDRLFVTNWGGWRPSKEYDSAPSAGTATAIDERGIAVAGTVSVIETAGFRSIAEIDVGLHPSAIRLSPDGRLAAIANANSDSVSLLDTVSLQVVDTVSISALPEGYPGSSPTALAFSPTGQWLYVACAGNNALAVLEREGGSYLHSGFVPTDWYPIAVGVSTEPDGGETVYVANSKGIGSRNATRNFSVYQFTGTINVVRGGAASLLSSYTAAVANDPFRGVSTPADSPTDLGRLGVRHLFLVIKENRTYDQILGDLGRGNGDSSLAVFGREVTPNHHALATQFVTLDNFYMSGTVSADGHQWLTQATVTDYIERAHASWPRSYPYSGEDPLAFARSGFIWNNAQARGLSVRVFGEFTLAVGSYTHTWSEYLADASAPNRQFTATSRSPIAALNPFIEREYPAFVLSVPDVWRARVFLEKLRDWETLGEALNLVILQLPTDHTGGTSPGQPTPDAMVADNDLALGRIVEAISKSSFWPRSAIFAVEDDAQNGFDHVDGHRSVCLLAGPYVRRGVVDSRQYNQTSILRTIEELLGLPPMNKFDASALPMRAAFAMTADLTSYTALPNRVPLDQVFSAVGLRGEALRAALDSAAMDFTRPDAAPEDRLNRIIWHSAKGWHVPYPRVPHGPFCRPEE